MELTNTDKIFAYLAYTGLDRVTYTYDFPGTPGVITRDYGLVLQGKLQGRTLCKNTEFRAFLRQENLFAPDVNDVMLQWFWDDLSLLCSRLEISGCKVEHEEGIRHAVEKYVTSVSVRLNKNARPLTLVGGKHEDHNS